MNLPSAVPRTLKHTRRITCEGYLRDDGLWDIDARIVDTKAYRYTEPDRGSRGIGEPVHDMSVRLTIDDAMTVRDIEHRLGRTAVYFLIASLCVTPLLRLGRVNLMKFRRLAEKQGLDPNVWFGNVEQGAARIVGRETVDYVGNIHKYYVAYKLARQRLEQRDKAASQAR